MWDSQLNFNPTLIFSFFGLLIISGCGVKAIPKVDQNQAVERYIREQSPVLMQEEKEKKNKAKNKQSSAETTDTTKTTDQ